MQASSVICPSQVLSKWTLVTHVCKVLINTLTGSNHHDIMDLVNNGHIFNCGFQHCRENRHIESCGRVPKKVTLFSCVYVVVSISQQPPIKMICLFYQHVQNKSLTVLLDNITFVVLTTLFNGMLCSCNHYCWKQYYM